MQGRHTEFLAHEAARQAKDTVQLTAAKGAASAAALAAASAGGSGQADADDEASMPAGGDDQPGCELVPCTGEAGEAVEANHNGAGEWKSGTIEAVNGDGTYTVAYTNEAAEKEENVSGGH